MGPTRLQKEVNLRKKIVIGKIKKTRIRCGGASLLKKEGSLKFRGNGNRRVLFEPRNRTSDYQREERGGILAPEWSKGKKRRIWVFTCREEELGGRARSGCSRGRGGG